MPSWRRGRRGESVEEIFTLRGNAPHNSANTSKADSQHARDSMQRDYEKRDVELCTRRRVKQLRFYSPRSHYFPNTLCEIFEKHFEKLNQPQLDSEGTLRWSLVTRRIRVSLGLSILYSIAQMVLVSKGLTVREDSWRKRIAEITLVSSQMLLTTVASRALFRFASRVKVTSALIHDQSPARTKGKCVSRVSRVRTRVGHQVGQAGVAGQARSKNVGYSSARSSRKSQTT